LEAGDFEGVVGGPDDEAVFAHVEDCAGGWGGVRWGLGDTLDWGLGDRLDFEDQDSGGRFVGSGEVGEGDGPGLEGADLAVDLAGGLGPVDLAHCLFQFRGAGDEGGVLWFALEGARFEAFEDVIDEAGA
jgi:hypothetical protein